MCQPPDISLPSADGADGHASNDGWSTPIEQWVPPAATSTRADPSMDSLAAQEQAILLKFGQQQQQQRQRAVQLAALASLGAPAAGQAATPWSHGFNHQNLTEKLQRAAAAATAHHGKDASSSSAWAHQHHGPHPLTAFGTPAAPVAAHHGMWPAAPASPALVPHLAPGLVAQGVPLGMAHMGHMESLNIAQHAAQQSEDDELDPKKYKRMMSNRASAKRSRARRQERLDELEIVSAKLQVENATVQRRLGEAHERIRKFQHENEALQSELRALKAMVEAKGPAREAAEGTDGGTASFCQLAETGGGEKQGTGCAATNQDSCGPHGSTTDHLSSEQQQPQPSCTPPSGGSSLGLPQKRKLEQGAESRIKGLKTEAEAEAEAYASPSLTQQQTQSPGGTSPGSNVTSASTDEEDSASGDEGVERVEEPVMVGPGIELLDDDLLSSFMEECFEAKPFEAALVQ